MWGNREDAIHYLIPPFVSPGVHALTSSLLNPANLPPRPESSSPSLKWVVTPPTSTARATKASSHSAPVLTVLLPAGSGLPKQIVFHRKGDYLASVCESGRPSESSCTCDLCISAFSWEREPGRGVDPPDE